MSGFGGFAPISNNSTVNQPAIQPGGVEPPPNAPAPNEPPQKAPAGVPGGDAAAKELVRSLDVLLARAGKAAGRTVDEAAIAKLAKGAKFDKATVDSLRTTAKAANEAMRVLDSFTGEDFANAMEVNQDTGVVDWNKYSYVGKSVKPPSTSSRRSARRRPSSRSCARAPRSTCAGGSSGRTSGSLPSICSSRSSPPGCASSARPRRSSGSAPPSRTSSKASRSSARRCTPTPRSRRAPTRTPPCPRWRTSGTTT